ncbi:hypothetical protein [Xanthomonas campestris]|uniref:hypothetical protein n=1 Tax=Xanthomonas campestris TaxID=339 RepID=UPI001E59F1CF|nr:hypothetical protein [Xanthomonas campestris]MCC5063621.1 hypothetical protein [Xanthomonas campestris pv. raphani]MEA9887100.1 hypothetical protein [Xanthomonas campestris pv. raphani]MEA9972904.1 hypothetical protein [Xanthomonas campestris pv. raphani]
MQKTVDNAQDADSVASAARAKDSTLPDGIEARIRQKIAELPYFSKLLGDAIENGRISAIAVSHGQNNGGHFQVGILVVRDIAC